MGETHQYPKIFKVMVYTDSGLEYVRERSLITKLFTSQAQAVLSLAAHIFKGAFDSNS